MAAAPAIVSYTAPAAAVEYKALLLGIVLPSAPVISTDMLALDADLEADLGIDSIKRVEIVGARSGTSSDISW